MKQDAIAGVTLDVVLDMLSQLMNSADRVTDAMADMVSFGHIHALDEQRIADATAVFKSSYLNDKGPFKNEETMKLELAAALGNLRLRFGPKEHQSNAAGMLMAREQLADDPIAKAAMKLTGASFEQLWAEFQETMGEKGSEPPEDLGPASTNLWQAWADAVDYELEFRRAKQRLEAAQCTDRALHAQHKLLTAWIDSARYAVEVPCTEDAEGAENAEAEDGVDAGSED